MDLQFVNIVQPLALVVGGFYFKNIIPAFNIGEARGQYALLWVHPVPVDALQLVGKFYLLWFVPGEGGEADEEEILVGPQGDFLG